MVAFTFGASVMISFEGALQLIAGEVCTDQGHQALIHAEQAGVDADPRWSAARIRPHLPDGADPLLKAIVDRGAV